MAEPQDTQKSEQPSILALQIWVMVFLFLWLVTMVLLVAVYLDRESLRQQLHNMSPISALQTQPPRGLA